MNKNKKHKFRLKDFLLYIYSQKRWIQKESQETDDYWLRNTFDYVSEELRHLFDGCEVDISC